MKIFIIILLIVITNSVAGDSVELNNKPEQEETDDGTNGFKGLMETFKSIGKSITESADSLMDIYDTLGRISNRVTDPEFQQMLKDRVEEVERNKNNRNKEQVEPFQQEQAQLFM